MKKISAILLGLFLLPAVSFAATFDSNLKVGMTGPDVANLQDFLSSEGCFSLQPTGYFGLVTFASVKCFQAKHGLPVTGFFGPLSRGEANQIFAEAVSSSNQAEVVETGTTTPIIQPTVQQNATPVQNPIPSTNQSFGGIIEQPIVNNQTPIPSCTLTAASDTAPIASYIQLTWTAQNVTAGDISNSMDSNGAHLLPVSGGTISRALDGEPGEANNNVFTATFTGPYGATSCQATVKTY